jgi:L-ascorbate metabolism protein UlaG (beta-lactamase superfamily)
MGRFDERATQPVRGPADILKWKLGKKDPTDHALDDVRPAIGEGGATALVDRECAVWIGHATWAFRLAGKLVVVDPIWSKSIGGAVKRLVAPGIALEDMPPIDIVLVTHDHRDHMDLPTLAKLPAEATYVTGTGNAKRLGKPHVVELDWWETTNVGELAITFVPARHWSMRMPWNRNATLWGGFVVQGPRATVYHSGDTAWGEHFAEIGKRFAIDYAMLPIGGYSPRWFMESQHIGPEEAGAAYEALGAKHLLAMHWGTYKLTDEAIGEPVARLRAWWAERGWAEDQLWIPPVGEPRAL